MPLPVPPINPAPYAPGPSTSAIPDIRDEFARLRTRIEELERRGSYSGSQIVVDNTGIQKPWLAMPTNVTLAGSIPNTQSGTFVTLGTTGPQLVMQPYCQLVSYIRSAGGGIGEARYVIDGVNQTPVIAIASGALAYTTAAVYALPGGIGTYTTIELQVRRTNAAGNVGAVFWATQRGNP